MKLYTIISLKTNQPLFEAQANSFIDCLETAANEGVSLHYADLSHQNLSNANLDDADLQNADFSHSNLTGANLSEARLQDCSFNGATMVNSCLAYSNLTHGEFLYSQFGATDITGASLEHAHFAGLSCFSLPFIQAATLHGSRYFYGDNDHGYTMNKAPIVTYGLGPGPLVALDTHILFEGKAKKK